MNNQKSQLKRPQSGMKQHKRFALFPDNWQKQWLGQTNLHLHRLNASFI